MDRVISTLKEIFYLQMNDEACVRLVPQLIERLNYCSSYNQAEWNIDKIVQVDQQVSMLVNKDPVNFSSIYNYLLSKYNPDCEASRLLRYLFELHLFKNNDKSLNTIQNSMELFPDNRAFIFLFVQLVYKDNRNELMADSQNRICNLLMLSQDVSEKNRCLDLALNISVKLFYQYVFSHDFKSAQTLLDKLENVTAFQNDTFCKNILAPLPYALDQSRSLYTLNQNTIHDLELKVRKLGEESNKRVFEILIIFTAVITFLVTAASTATSNTTTMIGLLSFGLMLLGFVISSLICLERPKSIRKDARFTILIIALIASVLIALIDKYDRFEPWSNKTINIEFPNKPSDKNNPIKVPFRLEQ